MMKIEVEGNNVSVELQGGFVETCKDTMKALFAIDMSIRKRRPANGGALSKEERDKMCRAWRDTMIGTLMKMEKFAAVISENPVTEETRKIFDGILSDFFKG